MCDGHRYVFAVVLSIRFGASVDPSGFSAWPPPRYGFRCPVAGWQFSPAVHIRVPTTEHSHPRGGFEKFGSGSRSVQSFTQQWAASKRCLMSTRHLTCVADSRAFKSADTSSAMTAITT